MEKRVELRASNLKAWDERPKLAGKLDSSIKKVSAFLRKLKGIEHGTSKILLQDLDKLNLSRYLSEVASAIAEARLSKGSDIAAAVEIASSVHQRYEEFSPELQSLLSKQLEMTKDLCKADDRKKNASRIRALLRLYCDLLWTAVFRDESPVLTALQDVIWGDKSCDGTFAEVSIIISFLKHCGGYFAGINEVSHEFAEEIVSAKTRKGIEKLVSDYFQSQCQRLQGMHKDLQKQKKANKKIEFYKGNVGEKQKNRLEELHEIFEKLMENVGLLATLLGKNTPEFEEEKEEEKVTIVADFDNSFDSIFEDEETMVFYEKLPNLRMILPPVLLEEGKEEDKLEERKVMEAQILEDGQESTGDVPAQQKYAFEVFLQGLGSALSRESVDTLSEQFCYFNTKGTRKRLVEALYSQEKQRMDVLPYFCRLTATLSQCFPDIGEEVVRLVKAQFFGLAQNKGGNLLDVKIRNARFIGELAKFGTAHHSLVFDCWNFCLNDFSSSSIHIFCALLETCGNWLYRNPETHERCELTLDRMQKLRKGKYLDQHLQNMIDNALFYCNPPERKVIQMEVRPLFHEYIRKRILNDLNETNLDQILTSILRLKWTEEIENYVFETLLDVGDVSFIQIKLIAQLAAGINKFHRLGSLLVDDVLEEIRLQLELNDARNRQRRLVFTRYLGELYNVVLSDSQTIFDTLYLFITFSPEDDHPADTFRVRLVSTLLESCGHYFSSSSKAPRLDRFLLYFQRYLFSKYLPIDSQFLVEDLFDLLRPSMARFSDMDECNQAIEVMEKTQLSFQDGLRLVEDLGNYVQPVGREVDEPKEDDEHVVGDEVDEEEEEEDDEEEEEEEEEEEYDWESRGFAKRVKPRSEEDAEFLSMFEKTFSESLEHRKYEPKQLRNLTDADGLALQASASFQHSRGPQSSKQGGNAVFQFVSRKQKGVAAKYLNIPSDVQLAVKNKQAEEEQKKEQEILKNFIVAGLERDFQQDATETNDYKRHGNTKRRPKPKPKHQPKKNPMVMEREVLQAAQSRNDLP